MDTLIIVSFVLQVLGIVLTIKYGRDKPKRPRLE